MNLCKFQDMNKCAKQYCDFWSEEDQMCGLAAEVHLKLNILRKIDSMLERSEEAAKKIMASHVSDAIRDKKEKIH